MKKESQGEKKGKKGSAHSPTGSPFPESILLRARWGKRGEEGEKKSHFQREERGEGTGFDFQSLIPTILNSAEDQMEKKEIGSVFPTCLRKRGRSRGSVVTRSLQFPNSSEGERSGERKKKRRRRRASKEADLRKEKKRRGGRWR